MTIKLSSTVCRAFFTTNDWRIMKEYTAICESDNLILGKTYLGYVENNTAVLTHVVSADRHVQLSAPIYTVENNVVPTGNTQTVGMTGKLKPYPRPRGHLRFVL